MIERLSLSLLIYTKLIITFLKGRELARHGGRVFRALAVGNSIN